MVNRRDDFASATQAWAQEAPAINALILGASYRSTYTSAFLDGIRKNPSMPKVLCIGPLNYHFKQLAKGSADCPQIQFTSRPLHTLMEEVKLACFDIALIDDYASAEEESLELLRGIKTILIRNVNTYFGFTLAQKLLSEGEYHIAYEGMARLTRSIIFTKKHPVSAGKAAAGRSINVG
jgi:hypothetical protein